MLILLERSDNYKIELKMSTSLSSSFSSSKTNQIKSLKIAMSSSIASSFFNKQYISTIVLKDKGGESTEVQTEPSPIITSLEEMFNQNQSALINILINYINMLNRHWEQMYRQAVEKSKMKIEALNNKISVLVENNTMLKGKIVGLVEGIRKYQYDNIKEKEKRNLLMHQLIKENEYLRKANEIIVLKHELNSHKESFNDCIENYARCVSNSTIRKKTSYEEKEIDEIHECLSSRSRSTVVNIENDKETIQFTK